ncbi:MAG: DNA starvation/stationary phase protection protein, partial [Bryobacteraceae bacterium]
MRNYHWNVTGPHFAQLHLLFGKQYEEVDDVIDNAAERIRALGGNAPGTLAEFQKLARLKEEPGVLPAAEKMIQQLVANHEAVIRSLRADLKTVAAEFGDDGTADFLTGLMEQHEKMAWLLRAH